MPQLAFWPLIDVCVDVCVWMWGDGCLMPDISQPPQCVMSVLMENYECGDDMTGVVKLPWGAKCIYYTDRTYTHTRMFSACLPSVLLVHLLWLSHVLFVLSHFLFSFLRRASRCTCLSLLQQALFSLYHWPCLRVCWQEQGQHDVNIIPWPLPLCRHEPLHVEVFTSQPTDSSPTNTQTAMTGCPQRPAITKNIALCLCARSQDMCPNSEHTHKHTYTQPAFLTLMQSRCSFYSCASQIFLLLNDFKAALSNILMKGVHQMNLCNMTGAICGDKPAENYQHNL